jgi:hypothetical protein
MRTQFRVWACLIALSIGLIPGLAEAEFAPNAQSARPLQVGDHAPDFIATHADGSSYAFSATRTLHGGRDG